MAGSELNRKQTWVLHWLQSCGITLEAIRQAEAASGGGTPDSDSITLAAEQGIASARFRHGVRKPILIQIRFPSMSEEDWEFLVHTAASEARYGAALAANRFDSSLAEQFAYQSEGRWPGRLSEESLVCSCETTQPVCSHIILFLLAIAERLQQEPLTLFSLRGRSAEQLLRQLRQQRSRLLSVDQRADVVSNARSLDREAPDSIPEESETGHRSTAHPRLAELTVPTFWTKKIGLAQLLDPVYHYAAEAASEMLSGLPHGRLPELHTKEREE